MPLEQDSLPLPSGSPPIGPDTPGITEEQAGAKIAQMLRPKTPAKGPDGRFQSSNPEPSVERPEPVSEPDESAPVADEGDEAAPSEEDIDLDDGGETEPTQAPSLEMPESWGKATEATWSSFTPEQQQFLKQHEAKRTQGIMREVNELKAEREKVTAASQALEQSQLQIAQAAARYADKTVQQFLSTFADIKSPEDVVKLSTENPARYLQYDAALKAAQASQQEADYLGNAQREQTRAKLQEFRTEENKKLIEMMNLTDEPTATAFEKQVTGYLGKLGIPMERISQYRADELIMAEKARKWDAAVAKRDTARKAANPPPPVLRPGAPSASRQLNAQAREKQHLSNLRKTGNETDAAAVIKSRLFGGRRT